MVRRSQVFDADDIPVGYELQLIEGYRGRKRREPRRRDCWIGVHQNWLIRGNG